MEQIKLPIVLDDGAILPTRAHATDAGLDLYALFGGVIPAHGSRVFRTGVHIQLPHGYCAIAISKSGLNIRSEIITTGLIDEGYDGEILVRMYNLGASMYKVLAGDKITQIAIVPVLYCEPYQVDAIVGGERGADGYGSTGR